MLRKRSEDLYEDEERISDIWNREVWEKLEEANYEFKFLVRQDSSMKLNGKIRNFGIKLADLVEEAEIISSMLEKE